MERLQKFLSRAGVASRRTAEQLISEGRVLVNGEVVTTLGTKVDASKDLVVVDGQPVGAPQARTYLVLYKPPGVVTTLSDPQGRPTVADFLGQVERRLFPVGRLDFDAEGALLLTDDGELANQVMHPSHQVPRVYLAKVKGEPDEASLLKLLEGVRLEDGLAHAVEARVYERAERNTWLKLVVTEGRQHLVKRLCAAIGHPVVRLFRPAHAGVSVAGLQPGQLRTLSPEEVRMVKAVAAGEAGPPHALFLPARRHGHGLGSSMALDREDDRESAEGFHEVPVASTADDRAMGSMPRGRGGAGRFVERRVPSGRRAFSAPGGRGARGERDRGSARARTSSGGRTSVGAASPGGGDRPGRFEGRGVGQRSEGRRPPAWGEARREGPARAGAARRGSSPGRGEAEARDQDRGGSGARSPRGEGGRFGKPSFGGGEGGASRGGGRFGKPSFGGGEGAESPGGGRYGKPSV